MNRLLCSAMLLSVLAAGAAAQWIPGGILPPGDTTWSLNPSTMIYEFPSSFAVIRPSLSGASGSLHRRYDPGLIQQGAFGADVVKVLGVKGTFRGTASYGVSRRAEQYSALRLEPYAGDPFQPVDTVSGAFLFTGPRMQFEYSYGLFDDLAIGFTAGYGVLDGLKDTYSNSHTVRRHLLYGAGAAYDLSPEVRLGVYLRGFSDQEAIESKVPDDLTESEVFSYRGETYATRRRSSSVSETFRSEGFEGQLEGRVRLDRTRFLQATAGYAVATLKSLFPAGGQLEFEDGLAQHQRMYGTVGLDLLIAEDLRGNVRLTVDRRDHWSKVSSRSLLLWEWNLTQAEVSGEVVWTTAPLVWTLGAAAGAVRVDSSKYIDQRRTKDHASPVRGFLGFSAPVSGSIRGEFRVTAGATDFDPAMAGRNLSAVALTASVTTVWSAAVDSRMSGSYVSVRGDAASVRRLRGGYEAGIEIILHQE